MYIDMTFLTVILPYSSPSSGFTQGSTCREQSVSIAGNHPGRQGQGDNVCVVTRE
jgi:hypothetical protein